MTLNLKTAVDPSTAAEAASAEAVNTAGLSVPYVALAKIGVQHSLEAILL